MLGVAEAVETVLAAISPLDVAAVHLEDALGRFAALDVTSAASIPPWDNSSMDGYAVRASDVAAGARLRVLTTIRAGARADRPVVPGEAMKIMTGAPVPDGADTVIRIEDTSEHDGVVTINDTRDTGRNVRQRAEDIAEGQLVISRGTRLLAPHIGVLASIGMSRVAVHAIPVVSILSTGDELVRVEDLATDSGTSIVSSNSYSLAALVRETGGVPVDRGLIADDPAALRQSLEEASGSDLIITSGGISVGEFDHTRGVIEAMGGRITFWKIRARPGANIAFGSVRGKPWLGLPGNPVSALIGGELFIRPILRKMMGSPRPYPRPITAIAADKFKASETMAHLFRAILTRAENGELYARSTGPQGSGILSSMAAANALLVVPAGRAIDLGEIVTAIPLDPDAHLTERLELHA
ncbi:MAG TPA: gephyrin-like molybdotransferase Glp [Gemmatimonadaceae bacterium]|nr:gephyrin-like molybdotransferase Glp [Gemmatimonadaceae bacterium]